MISILVLFSYPLQLFPCRNSVLKVIDHKRNQADSRELLHHPLPTTSQDLDREEDVESTDVERPDGPLSNDPASLKLFIGITAFLLLGSFLIAVNVERLETVGRIFSRINAGISSSYTAKLTLSFPYSRTTRFLDL